jgi:cyanophycinase
MRRDPLRPPSAAAWLAFLASALTFAAPACAPVAPAGATRAVHPTADARGSLFIVGGGPRPAELMRHFVELAGGAGARIVVIPLASASPAATGEAQAAELTALGARATALLFGRTGADSARVTEAIAAADGVWFSGGVQSRITDAMGRTAAEAALLRRYREGAAIGGTSAGAAIMSTAMITGDERRPGGARASAEAWITIDRENVVVVPGLGLLPYAIVDQHFVRRRRHNRLLSLVLERPERLGVGIDEGTALIVRPGGIWDVVGESVVVIYDARGAEITPGAPLGGAGVRMHVLPAGGRFVVAERRARVR